MFSKYLAILQCIICHTTSKYSYEFQKVMNDATRFREMTESSAMPRTSIKVFFRGVGLLVGFRENEEQRTKNNLYTFFQARTVWF